MPDSQATRALAEIEKQLVELSRLRNANTRDSDFKVWRQTTLTLIQRIWEGDDARSSRFRAVPFSPGTTRPDPKLAREWFERGCAEAAQVLRALIEEINQHGIVKAASVEILESEALPEDDNVPILSLDDPSPSRSKPSIADEPDDMRLSDEPARDEFDLDEMNLDELLAEEAEADDEPEAAEELDETEEPREIADIPDPPGARPPRPLSRGVNKPAPRAAETPRSAQGKPAASKPAAPKLSAGAKRPADPAIPISETAPPGPSRGVTVSNGGSKSGGKKPPGKDHLKDMLGFEPGSRYTPPAQQKSQPPAQQKSQPSVPAAKAPASPPPAKAPAPPAQQKSPPSAPRAAAPPPAARPTPTHSQRPAAPPAPPARAQTPRRDAPPPDDLEHLSEHFGTIAPESVSPLDPGGRSGEFTPTRPPAPSRPAPPVERAQPSHDEPEDEAPQVGETQGGLGAPIGYDEHTLKRAFEAALHSIARRRADAASPPDAESASQPDILDSSPVFSVTSKPAKQRGPDPQGRYHTATAIAMAALATEVEAMGVPATDCSRAREALLELADHFERRDLTWSTVREAVRVLVEWPVVARRVLPLLVPHLDEAA